MTGRAAEVASLVRSFVANVSTHDALGADRLWTVAGVGADETSLCARLAFSAVPWVLEVNPFFSYATELATLVVVKSGRYVFVGRSTLGTAVETSLGARLLARMTNVCVNEGNGSGSQCPGPHKPVERKGNTCRLPTVVWTINTESMTSRDDHHGR